MSITVDDIHALAKAEIRARLEAIARRAPDPITPPTPTDLAQLRDDLAFVAAVVLMKL